MLAIARFNIIDNTKEDFALIELGNVTMYEKNDTILHVTNITICKEIVEKTKKLFKDNITLFHLR